MTFKYTPFTKSRKNTTNTLGLRKKHKPDKKRKSLYNPLELAELEYKMYIGPFSLIL